MTRYEVFFEGESVGCINEANGLLAIRHAMIIQQRSILTIAVAVSVSRNTRYTLHFPHFNDLSDFCYDGIDVNSI